MSDMSSSEKPEFCWPIRLGSSAFWVAVIAAAFVSLILRRYKASQGYQGRARGLTLLGGLRIIILVHWEAPVTGRRHKSFTVVRTPGRRLYPGLPTARNWFRQPVGCGLREIQLESARMSLESRLSSFSRKNGSRLRVARADQRAGRGSWAL
jgi:hypothetical protein